MKLCLVVTFSLLIFACSASSNNLLMNKPNHHTAEGFQNYPTHEPSKFSGIGFVLRQVWHSMFPVEMNIEFELGEEQSLKLLSELKGRYTMTWLGHASFLIHLNGKNILLDPHLTKYAGPVPMMGPWRFSKPGISIDNLPPIDVVVISHNHYDHLSKGTLDELPNKGSIEVIVPLKMGAFFRKLGYKNINELDWHESMKLEDLTFRALPAVHHSGRGLGDQDKVLWASWLITSDENELYFAGDTAYSETIFKEIGNLYGPINWALLPIGAYEPVEVLRSNHLNPRDAVNVGVDVKATNVVAMHWGTFNLSDEAPDEPPRLFLKAGENTPNAPKLWVLKIGESLAL